MIERFDTGTIPISDFPSVGTVRPVSKGNNNGFQNLWKVLIYEKLNNRRKRVKDHVTLPTRTIIFGMEENLVKWEKINITSIYIVDVYDLGITFTILKTKKVVYIKIFDFSSFRKILISIKTTQEGKKNRRFLRINCKEKTYLLKTLIRKSHIYDHYLRQVKGSRLWQN